MKTGVCLLVMLIVLMWVISAEAVSYNNHRYLPIEDWKFIYIWERLTYQKVPNSEIQKRKRMDRKLELDYLQS